MAGLKVKLKDDYKSSAFIKGKIYDVISVEKDWYRIMTELDEDYIFPPHLFDIVEDKQREQ